MKKQITLLLLFFLFPLIAGAQDTIRTLIISEAGFGWHRHYAELTNVGDAPLNLSDFIIESINVSSNPNASLDLPDHDLAPGESYIISEMQDLPEKFPTPGYINPPFPLMHEYVDLEIHIIDDQLSTMAEFDSVTVNNNSRGGQAWQVLKRDHGKRAFALYYRVPGGDPVIVDAIRYKLTAEGYTDGNDLDAQTVAGYLKAWDGDYCNIYRKTTVAEGNYDWDNARGTTLEDSEWMPVPRRRFTSATGFMDSRWYTTLGNFENATLSAEFIKDGNGVTFDWDANTVTIPFGIYKDSVEYLLILEDGIAWQYYSSPVPEDSTHNIAITGDTLKMYAIGDDLEEMDFGVIQAEPADDMALVFSKSKRQFVIAGQNITTEVEWLPPYYVTFDQPGMDTIGNLGFAERVDSLYKFVEKAPKASWEIVWVDGNERADLLRGDILIVTAENGSTVKEYFLDVDTIPEVSHIASLSAITWPDAPEDVLMDPAWHGDTIPLFNGEMLHFYRVKLPYLGKNIPALQAHTVEMNATVSVDRAVNLYGTLEDRTTIFTVTAEDDTTVEVYTVIFFADKPQDMSQPFEPDPIITEIDNRRGLWGSSIEISNPGNRPLDLSNYMIASSRKTFAEHSPAGLFQYSDNYLWRWKRYIPGYEYQSEVEWNVEAGIVEKDMMVNPILNPGESFVIGANVNGTFWDWPVGVYNHNRRTDVLFTRENIIENPENYNAENCKIIQASVRADWGRFLTYTDNVDVYILYKIKNDSIKGGTKGVVDPADFESIDVFGNYTKSASEPCGEPLSNKIRWSIMRKQGFWEGRSLPGVLGSFGATPEESEWITYDEDDIRATGEMSGFAWVRILNDDLGFHYFDPVFTFSSTVTSYSYSVSQGYQTPQTIEAVITGTNVSDFIDNILKSHADQTLEVIGKTGSDVLVTNDTLKVISADSVNMTKYVLTVSNEGLSDDAVLTAKDGSGLTISNDGATGTILGIPFGRTIQEIIEKVIKPESAVLNFIDGNSNLVPVRMKNSDGVYVYAQATGSVYFEVVAEDNVTKIIYQLEIEVADNEIYAYSDYYSVDQGVHFISGIPTGTNVGTFFTYLKATQGATIALVDKTGSERVMGDVRFDDKVVVTSADGTVSKVYYLNFIEEKAGIDAYVVSDVLDVDQDEKTISGIPANTQMNIFLGLVTPAPRATITILDDGGNVVDSGVIGEGYQLKVTSEDGSKEVIYDLVIIVSVDVRQLYEMSIYPNPATDNVFVKGIRPNSKVVIVSILGRIEKMVNCNNASDVTISVAELPAGIYFIYSQTENHRSKPVKLIIE